MTEGFVNPAAPWSSSMLPGAFAKRRLLVMAATMTVAIRDALNLSDDTTTTGLR